MGRWIALYSQTGAELREVSTKLERLPDVIFTNNIAHENSVSHKTIQKWLAENLTPDDVVTLHGYLRIIEPEVIATGAKIYNGHPGFIYTYPELKGKDPQEKLYLNQDRYSLMGCVVHEVTEEVDDGKILAGEAIVTTPNMTLEYVYETLHDLSVKTWLSFLRREFACTE